MSTSPKALVRVVAAVIAVSIAGCSSATMQNLVKQQEDYNRAKCQEFGLQPGSNAYVQCISGGADAYAAAVKNSGGGGGTPAPVFPFWPGWPAQQNNACKAPVSTPQGGCAGCSVSCGTQQASCTPGQEWLGGSETCMTPASCACR